MTTPPRGPRRDCWWRLAAVAAAVVLHLEAYWVASRVAEARGRGALCDFTAPLDAHIPFLAWSWPFYWAAYPFILLGGASVVLPQPDARFRRAIAAFAAVIVVGAAVQAVFPASRPIPHLPHPGQALIHWSSQETPLNTFPSMHVTFVTFIAALAFTVFRRSIVRAAFVVLAVLIAISTLTLKEHVVLDVLAGALLGGVACWWWSRERSGEAQAGARREFAMPSPTPDVARLFRLPWTASDNAMTWLEPTRKCNIVCDACFAENDPRSHKPLPQIQHEMETMLALRHCDAMLIAGGEPLTYPGIVEVVAMVKRAGIKPVVVTNGVSLDQSLLRELKRAGAYGLTLHVDAHQSRPGWEGKSEKELNALRTAFAEMLHEAGGLTCAFNTTIFPDTLASVPDIVAWAVERPDKVHILTLICVRMVEPDGPFRYYVGGRAVDIAATPYATARHYEPLTTEDIYREVRRVLPDFAFCAYLGGTVRPQSLKWVIGCHLASGGRSYGPVGPRFMEIMQNGSHAVRGRYLAYSSPKAGRMGRAALLLGIVDSEVRRTAARFATDAFRHPLALFRRLYVQSLSVVQPVDILDNGEMDTCDGCPNRTFWQDRLVPACRLDEYQRFGGPLHAAPREHAPEEAEPCGASP